MKIFNSQGFSRHLSLVINRYSIFLLGIYLYVLVVGYRGGIDSRLFYSQWTELLLLLYFYIYFYFILKHHRWRSLLAALPIIAGYLVQDAYYLFYGKVFRLIEILELPELLQVITFGYGVMVVVFLIVPLMLFFSVINYRKLHVITMGALPLGLLSALIIVSPNAYTDFIHAYGNGVVIYSDTSSVEKNGRYTMLFYKEAQRLNALTMTEPYRKRVEYEQIAETKAENLRQHSNHQNVHLIVLESFLDPRLFRRASFNRYPVHPDFEKIFGKKLGLSMSSVFGGATAQAEFEVLCGVPALEKLSSVEFNVFTGSPVYCLPGILEKTGYRTIATNAYKPNFFNALPAYKGIGFSEIYFPREYASSEESYFSIKDVSNERYMFDSALFEQNLAFVAKSLEENRTTPLFNYMMTIYGHTPHTLDPAKRPEIIQVKSDYPDDHLQRSTNQFYYRTQAIAKYIKELIKLDKNSLIILVSDHVPPLRNGPNTYRELDYMGNIANYFYYNRLMIIDNAKPVVYRNIRHFDMADIVYNYITDGDFCRQKSCAFLEKTPMQERESFLDQYYSLMAHASE